MKFSKIILLIIFMLPIGMLAQDYTKQIEALKQGFTEKSITPVSAYLSSELKFDPAPAAATPSIFGNLIKGISITDISILDSEKGKAKVKYSLAKFDELPASLKNVFKEASDICFDGEGKISRIEFVENYIRLQMEKQASSVQAPNPGALAEKYPSKTIEFPAADGLLITGDLYEVNKNSPIILLCHQGGANRNEFLDIARNLNEMGYNCFAIDQRSGGDFAGKTNLTFKRATEKGISTKMQDAGPDLTAAINFLHKRYNKRVIVLGSSYSASLALIEAESNSNVKAVISFSPGAAAISKAISNIKVPFLITSSKEEAPRLTKMIGSIQLKNKQRQYIPTTEGFHGASTLWNGQKGAEEYWKEVAQFLSHIK